ncbi:unannotated protein [freshwater metagenome]|uniref:Unannotated protein n=1 Tax=freshwater metagenome TaxID=449393 RepID=A0A6J7CC98_9ZZZZ|nr:NAD-dependent epimerase/dehydratase family protein [Actinomycetota bacterium]MSW25680.1 NAD-dependent epimerase/dehydratase family protein [Actinomycetota bacterium]MSW33412.1 NAD-dependent epimerase/dehydratase family protein [Actinomycetota bacterium]MSX30436.1 NAD-dependent epimerase/dehydratase family protein [Actinomycetota bacterium]MSX51332.1 NAD-dependent epimerase/dehydratase family protein [Actinomycetota bacterium]
MLDKKFSKFALDKIDFHQFSNKTILITGASGLIGTNLLSYFDLLAARGLNFRLLAVTNSNSLPDCLQNKTWITEFHGDLSNDIFLAEIPPFDFLFHAAGYGQPGKFKLDPLKTIKLNTSVLLHLAGKLNMNGKAVFLSTSEVYSGSCEIPSSEDRLGTYSTNSDRSPYIEAKRCGEAIMYSLNQSGNRFGRSARVALAYGPGGQVNDVRVLNEFIISGLRNGFINVKDLGEAMRTYCYVDDAIDLIFWILLHGTSDVYNVGGTSRVSISNLAELIASKLEVPFSLGASTNKDVTAPADVQLDLTKIIEESRKDSFIPFNEGLDQTIHWYRELLAGAH